MASCTCTRVWDEKKKQWVILTTGCEIHGGK